MTPTTSLQHDIRDNLNQLVCKNEKIKGTDYLVMGSYFNNNAGLIYKFTMVDLNFVAEELGTNMFAIASHPSSSFLVGTGGSDNSLPGNPLRKRFVADHSNFAAGILTELDLFSTSTSEQELDALMTEGEGTYL